MTAIIGLPTSSHVRGAQQIRDSQLNNKGSRRFRVRTSYFVSRLSPIPQWPLPLKASAGVPGCYPSLPGHPPGGNSLPDCFDIVFTGPYRVRAEADVSPTVGKAVSAFAVHYVMTATVTLTTTLSGPPSRDVSGLTTAIQYPVPVTATLPSQPGSCVVKLTRARSGTTNPPAGTFDCGGFLSGGFTQSHIRFH